MFNNNENPSLDNDVLTVANRPSPSARILYNDVIIIMHDTIIIIIHYYELFRYPDGVEKVVFYLVR